MPKFAISKFTIGLQPCAGFRPAEDKPARHCDYCDDAVKWCQGCLKDIAAKII